MFYNVSPYICVVEDIHPNIHLDNKIDFTVDCENYGCYMGWEENGVVKSTAIMFCDDFEDTDNPYDVLKQINFILNTKFPQIINDFPEQRKFNTKQIKYANKMLNSLKDDIKQMLSENVSRKRKMSK